MQPIQFSVSVVPVLARRGAAVTGHSTAALNNPCLRLASDKEGQESRNTRNISVVWNPARSRKGYEREN